MNASIARNNIRQRMAKIESSDRRRKKTVEVRKTTKGPVKWIVFAVCALIAVIILSPLLIMVLNAFKSASDYNQNGPISIPDPIYVGGIVKFWNHVNFPLKFVNSLIISLFSAFIAVALSLITSFALGIGRIKGHAAIVGILMVMTMLPSEGFVYPLFYMFDGIGLGNSRTAVIIITAAFNMLFGTYFLSSVMSTFPRELLEAAQIDGASRWKVLTSVVFPIVKSNCAVLFAFFFIWVWNEFYYTLIFLSSTDKQTIPLAIASLQNDKFMDATTINAGSFISMIPALIFFLMFQRTLAKGLTAGAVK